MKSGLIIPALLLAAPLFSAVSTGTTTIDSSGHVWRTGNTNFILASANGFQKTAISQVCATYQLSPFSQVVSINCNHAYLTEQDASGNILYATYLAGSDEDGGTAITTDAQGNVYVAGYTYSSDFPVTKGAFQTTNAGPTSATVIPQGLGPFGPVAVFPGGDAFVAKFAPDGTLLFSTLLGGSGEEIPSMIAVDASGAIYVAGTTSSANFPVTAGALSHAASSSNFFARLSADGSMLAYSTYSDATIQSFWIDSAGDAYLTGFSQTSASNGGPYVTAINTSAQAVLFTTFIPTLNPNILAASGAAIAAEPSGNVFLGVSPASRTQQTAVYTPPEFPLGPSSLLQLSADGSRIVTETDIDNAQFDSLQIDSSGDVYAFGHGTGTLPAGPTPLLASPCAASGASFVIETDPTGKILAATYLRQGSDSTIQITSPGHFKVLRSGSPAPITIDLTLQPTMNFGCLDNLGSGELGAGLAPGEIFVIYGNGIGPAQAAIGTPDASGLYPTTLGGVQVQINGVAAPLIYVQAGEIHGVAPFSLPVTAPVQITNGSASAPPLDVASSQTNPAILTIGGGQAAVINQDGTVNSPSNPAKLGSAISIYATGTGYLENQLPDGSLTPITPPLDALEFAVQATFVGVQGTTLWAGSAPGLIVGLTQVNVQLPASLPDGTNLNAVPVVLNSSVFSPPAPISVKP
jgi:uncharacterized protein (TIGR03437 family)